MGLRVPNTNWQKFYYVLGAGRLSAYDHGMGKMTHGWDGSIERRFDLLEEHEAIEICGK